MQGLDSLYALLYHKSFKNTYVGEGGELLSDRTIRSQACGAIFQRNEQVASIFMTYVRALIFEDALRVIKAVLGMKVPGQDDNDHLYNCHMTYMDSVFEE